ncbi:gluconate:H+ symporter [Microbispora amethystogenes]|uniref:Gluconate:H+ symporter, GntP family protein n=1 Tax=Microbispora amethystogenes TaxID=1427754 RepID=A0ABQ4FCJ5_9ACTN|nr:gluconate:H+ symporter [Microbispora amethystogenes]GIH32540.1 gluconate:H+ symporter, GntP family protein [Microbispora amethystogenes]
MTSPLTSLVSTPPEATLRAAAAWSGHDTRLILAALAGIAVIVLLITKLRAHPFLALAIGSGTLGLVAGMAPQKLIDSFSAGLGSTVAGVGVLIALGAMLGKLLADSGGADEIVDGILRRTGDRALPWAMTLIAVLIGLPMFFEIGLVLLIPVILLVARRSSRPLLLIAVPALAGLSVLHGLVPPHPGPLVAIDTLKADLGLTLGLGLLVAIPTVIVAGPLFARFAARWVEPTPPERLEREQTPEPEDGERRRPSFGVTVATILLPVVLMLGRAVAEIVLPEGGAVRTALEVLGTPLIALLIAVIVAMFTLGRPAGLGRGGVSSTIADSLPPIAGILLIVGAGGGFKQTLVDSGVGKVIGEAAQGANVPVLVLGWLIAVGIRLATGSATVATISAAGIAAPLAAGLSPAHVALLVLAIGAGSLFFSHVNDAGFWLVKEYLGMSVGQTIRTWSIMETIISVVAFCCVLLLGLVV